ncbi:MAG: response regulator [Anaerolineales bacterium]|nr:response regulator [Anaerolineales bacterium]
MAKILVVDDAQFLRLRITKMLSLSGHDTLEAENGKRAVEVYQTSHPDVVLMDVTMPEMDGLAALKQIRAIDTDARIVMLTALGQESLVIEAIRAGAKDFIVKPFEASRVLSAINKIIS